MTTAALIAGLSAGLAVAVPLGSIGVMIVDTGIRDGGRSAFAAGLGTATVDGLYAAAARCSARRSRTSWRRPRTRCGCWRRPC
jgi:threonine/homoserine/homoserine lactone efflux protein